MTRGTSVVAVCCSKASRVSGDEPSVLHRDDGLLGKTLEQSDVLVGEGTNLLAVDRDRAEQPGRSSRSERHEQRGTRPAPRSTIARR